MANKIYEPKDVIKEPRYLKLQDNNEGGIDVISVNKLGEDGWYLISFNIDGTLSLHPEIHERCDLQLADDGTIKTVRLGLLADPETPVKEGT